MVIKSILIAIATLLTAEVAVAGIMSPTPAKVRVQPVATTDTHLLYIEGVISRSTMGPVQQALDAAVEDEYSGQITIVINSPGGEVVSGMKFVNAMNAAKAGGATIDCYVTDMAASMAFQIFTQCSNRHALLGSYLLWHGVRMGSNQPITAKLAQLISDDLAHMDLVIKHQLYSTVGRDFSEEDIDENFEAETLWSGLELAGYASHFVQAQLAFPGLMPQLKRAVRTSQMNFLDMLFGGEIIYIWERYVVEHSRPIQ